MSFVEPSFAEWLGSEARFVEAVSADARWTAIGAATRQVSSLATRAAAVAEAARQVRFAGGPLALDRHLVSGLQRDLLGKVVGLTIDQLGYRDGGSCFVIAIKERDTVEMTELLVLRRL